MADHDTPLFALDPEPVFWAPVTIPMAGGKHGVLRMKFPYLDRDAYQAFFAQHAAATDAEAMPKLVLDWQGADAPFSEDALLRLLKNYPQAGKAIIQTFRDELFGVAEKN